jgi:hypothetical protein
MLLYTLLGIKKKVYLVFDLGVLGIQVFLFLSEMWGTVFYTEGRV